MRPNSLAFPQRRSGPWRVRWLLAALSLCGLRAEPLYPEIQSLVVFGDGYSDGGRLSGAVSTSDPFLVWVDYLATALGVPAAAPYHPTSAPGGLNFALSGATAGDPPIANFPSGKSQIDEYMAALDGAALPADTLYIVWLGTIDLHKAENLPETAAEAVYEHLQRLANAGGRQFLVPELVPMGMMPLHLDQAALYDNRAAAFNASLDTYLAALSDAYPDVWFKKVAVYTLFESIRAHPSAFGFANITQAAFLPGSASDPNTFLWWDSTHPTSAAHAHIADFAMLEIASALGQVSAAQLTLVLDPSPAGWTLSVRGPALAIVSVEMTSDGVTWMPIATFAPFSGLETIALENDALEAPRLYRAR